MFPGGITHELRALDPFPVYIDRAKGSHKWAVDGPELIDYFSGHGALLLGHSPDDVVAAVQRQMARATHPGACHEMEIEWGRLVQKIVPSAGMVRFTASGTEATLMALRLARIATGRPKILKFMGHFHGWHDAVMPGAYQPYDGSPVPGIPEAVQRFTVVLPPNDLNRVEDALKNDPEIGTVILEPTGGHWGLVPIRGPFLKGLRELTTKYDRVLIFDEVITGFRVAPGGAQQAYGVTPDMTTLAKILAGGLPGGCVAGRPDLLASMEKRPGKPKMNHPGTFNANPLSAAAGITALKRVATGEPCGEGQSDRHAAPQKTERTLHGPRSAVGRVRRFLAGPPAAGLPWPTSGRRRFPAAARNGGAARRAEGSEVPLRVPPGDAAQRRGLARHRHVPDGRAQRGGCGEDGGGGRRGGGDGGVTIGSRCDAGG